MFREAVAEEKLRGMWDREEVDRCWFTNPDSGFLPRLKATYLPALWM